MKKAIFIIIGCFLLAAMASPAIMSASYENETKNEKALEASKKVKEKLMEDAKKANEKIIEQNKKNTEKYLKQIEVKAEKKFKNKQAQKNFIKQTKKKIEIVNHKIKQVEEKIKRAQKELTELLKQKEKLLAVLNNSNTDNTAPVISSIAVNNIATSTATITWLTDESSNSILKYGTSTANYIFSKEGIQTGTTTPFAHAINLSGLTASTTYYYIVSSKDNSGNIATSSENIFTALSL